MMLWQQCPLHVWHDWPLAGIRPHPLFSSNITGFRATNERTTKGGISTFFACVGDFFGNLVCFSRIPSHQELHYCTLLNVIRTLYMAVTMAIPWSSSTAISCTFSLTLYSGCSNPSVAAHLMNRYPHCPRSSHANGHPLQVTLPRSILMVEHRQSASFMSDLR